MFDKKAQSALEYLTTYGWALLAILGIIGVLTYTGMGSVEDKIPTSCNFGTGFSCGAFYGITNGSFAFELKNMQRTAINITAVNCSFSDYGSDSVKIPLVETTFNVGDSAIIYCNVSKLSHNISASGKEKYFAKVYYSYDEQSSLPKAITGELIVPISDDVSIINQYIAQAIPEK